MYLKTRRIRRLKCLVNGLGSDGLPHLIFQFFHLQFWKVSLLLNYASLMAHQPCPQRYPPLGKLIWRHNIFVHNEPRPHAVCFRRPWKTCSAWGKWILRMWRVKSCSEKWRRSDCALSMLVNIGRGWDEIHKDDEVYVEVMKDLTCEMFSAMS